jgi:hypothetical protein
MSWVGRARKLITRHLNKTLSQSSKCSSYDVDDFIIDSLRHYSYVDANHYTTLITTETLRHLNISITEDNITEFLLLCVGHYE